MKLLFCIGFFLALAACASSPDQEHHDCVDACRDQPGDLWGKCVARCGPDSKAAPR